MAKGMEHARARGAKSEKTLEHLRIYKGAEGGHIVEHHFEGYEHPPERHPFGQDEGAKLHGHLSEHMGIECENCDGDGDGDE